MQGHQESESECEVDQLVEYVEGGVEGGGYEQEESQVECSDTEVGGRMYGVGVGLSSSGSGSVEVVQEGREYNQE